mmetsp:Transcript_21578/g.43847  ORF Transcript_21578/g.43847 Transcript_21578/m.43847 type:complete len:87 (-) Transcript_21578:224-484(-)
MTSKISHLPFGSFDNHMFSLLLWDLFFDVISLGKEFSLFFFGKSEIDFGTVVLEVCKSGATISQESSFKKSWDIVCNPFEGTQSAT